MNKCCRSLIFRASVTDVKKEPLNPPAPLTALAVASKGRRNSVYYLELRWLTPIFIGYYLYSGVNEMLNHW